MKIELWFVENNTQYDRQNESVDKISGQYLPSLQKLLCSFASVATKCIRNQKHDIVSWHKYPRVLFLVVYRLIQSLLRNLFSDKTELLHIIRNSKYITNIIWNYVD